MQTLTQQVKQNLAGKPHTQLMFHSHRAKNNFVAKTAFENKIVHQGASTVEFSMRIDDKNMQLLIRAHGDLIYSAYPVPAYKGKLT